MVFADMCTKELLLPRLASTFRLCKSCGCPLLVYYSVSWLDWLIAVGSYLAAGDACRYFDLTFSASSVLVFSSRRSGLAKLDERFFGFSKLNPEFFRGAQ